MSTRTSCRSFAVVLVVNAFIWNRSSAFFMLTSLSARNNFSRNLCAEARAVGCWCLAARIRGAPSRSAAGRATDSNFIPTVKGWVMSSASSSTVALQNQVKGAKRDDVPIGGLAEARLQENSTPEGNTSGVSVTAGSSILAQIVPAEEPWLTEAGTRLREGKLVAFPTETVYGLGANALSESAVLKIFEAKRRPLTDPLIVHVPDSASALAFLDFDGVGGGGDKARRLLALLGEKLWPGPLTLILKASDAVPACVTANTGFVGVRCPAHPVTRQLLRLAGVPMAGPSANRFGHVSPTRAKHVTADLGDSDIMVVNGDTSGACCVGIESTVAKIDIENNRILVLRMGGVTQAKLKEALASGGGAEFAGMSVLAGSVAGGKAGGVDATEKVTTLATGVDGGEAQEAKGQAPGQLLKHYSPDLDVFRVLPQSAAGGSRDKECFGAGDGKSESEKLESLAKTSVVIDFAGHLKRLEAVAQAYVDLSERGDAAEAAAGLFEGLRWAEAQPSAQRLLISGLPSASCGDMAAAVNDRIYRAASGKTIVD